MPSYGIAVPGTVVPSGSQASPAGAQGIQGPAGSAGSAGSAGPAGANAWTLSSASFTVPNVGSTAVMSVNDASWAVVGEFVWVATAGGSASVPMALQVTAKTATSLTLLNPPTAGMQASGDANNLLTIGSDSLLYLPPSRLPVMTATVAGIVPTPPNDNTKFLSGDATFAAVPSPPAAGLGVAGIIPATDVSVFTTVGANTWTKPTVGTPRSFRVICMGGGGGGSSGEFRAAGTACGGGAGGSGGCIAIMDFRAGDLSASTYTAQVGDGGAGGARTTVAGLGKAGTQGSPSWFGVSATSAFVQASGGQAGQANTAGTGAAAGANNNTAIQMFGVPGPDGGAGGTAGAAGAAAIYGSNMRQGGGGGGGGAGIATTFAALSGGAGSPGPGGYGGNPGGSSGGSGFNGSGAYNASAAPGDGGGGGANSNAAGQNNSGGMGGWYGGGGGGGGASTTVNTSGSGAGGKGGQGFVMVITYF